MTVILVGITLLLAASTSVVVHTLFVPRPVKFKEPAVLFEGQYLQDVVCEAEDIWLLPFALVKEHIDQSALWDSLSRSVVFTTEDKLLRLPTDSLTAFVNLKPVPMSQAAKLIQGEPFVPLEVVAALCSLEWYYNADTNVLVIDRATAPAELAKLRSASLLRKSPTILSLPVAHLIEGEQVKVLGSSTGWAHVQTRNGLLGFIPLTILDSAAKPTLNQVPEAARSQKWHPPGGLVNLTWEYVTQPVTPIPSAATLKGVNVLCPTWFHLKDPDGNVQATADPAYVRWAHFNGIRVWGLVSNQFDRELTHKFLGSALSRENFIRQMLAWCNALKLDGINVDFENMEYEDRGLFVQLIRELAPLTKEQGLVLSVDVTVKSSSPNWSLCYDRSALAKAADYVILMAYDQTPAGSPIPGPTAALPWVEQGIRSALAEVPGHKLVLGIPFYTRVWKVPPGSKGATSRAASMDEVETLLKQHKAEVTFDSASGQRLAQYAYEGYHWVIWVEDQDSVRARAELVTKYALAGIASWRRGFESARTWATIADTLSRAQYQASATASTQPSS
ncbi:MAG: glycosyl hydrolase family 18 protein [Bacillota bacterium]